MKRADGTENVLEARKTIFGTMIYGGGNNNHKLNNENKPISAAQGNVEIHEKEPENILNIKETPLDILLKRWLTRKEMTSLHPVRKTKVLCKKEHMMNSSTKQNGSLIMMEKVGTRSNYQDFRNIFILTKLMV